MGVLVLPLLKWFCPSIFQYFASRNLYIEISITTPIIIDYNTIYIDSYSSSALLQ